MSFPPSPRGETRIRWTSRVPPPLLGWSSTRLRNQWKTPCWNSRSTPNRRPSIHSNGCSLHSNGTTLRKAAWRSTAPSGSIRVVNCGAGRPSARFTRSVLETRGHNCRGEASRSHDQSNSITSRGSQAGSRGWSSIAVGVP